MAERKKPLKGLKWSLPTKNCMMCDRPFQYRKKWREDWETIKFCSEKCKNDFKIKQAKKVIL